jgi:hypothetical protein
LQVVLKMPQIRDILSRRVEDLAARKRLYLWAQHGRNNDHVVYSGAKPAVCFWHSTSGSRKLPDVAVDGLLSAVLVGHLAPKLYTFDEFDNIPSGVELRKAGDAMSWGEFKIMQKKGVELPIISDIIRLRILCKSQGDYAWFWDVDTLVLADLSTIGVKPDAFQHVLASMERPRSKAGTTTAAFEEHCICNFLCSPRDKAYPLLVVIPGTHLPVLW